MGLCQCDPACATARPLPHLPPVPAASSRQAHYQLRISDIPKKNLIFSEISDNIFLEISDKRYILDLYLPYGTSYSKTTHFLLACSVSLHHSTISQTMICSQQECPAILHRGGACGGGGVYGGTTGSEGYTLVNPEGEGESIRLCCAGANAGGMDVARLAITVYLGQL